MIASDPALHCDCHLHVFDAKAPAAQAHYAPQDHPLEAIEALAAAHGVRRFVLVQPSVYSHNNEVMLQALRASAGQHRGVAVVTAGVSELHLAQMHALGVRGVRFNLVSPVGNGHDVAGQLSVLAPKLKALGWHAQVFARAEQLPQVLDWQRQTGLRFVLDHLAGLHAGLAQQHPAWGHAQALAEGGAWIKYSGWYRLSAKAPHGLDVQAPMERLAANVARVAAWFGPRAVWGSDWPHTGLAQPDWPAYNNLFKPVEVALGPAALAQALGPQAHALYFSD